MRRSFRGSTPETTRLVERFTPTGPNTIEWRVTVEDPETWTSPFTFAAAAEAAAR